MKNETNQFGVWHRVHKKKDMPKKSGYYLMLTNPGWGNPLTFKWCASKRKGYILSARNHCNKDYKLELDGPIDLVEIDWEDPSFCWTNIPEVLKLDDDVVVK